MRLRMREAKRLHKAMVFLAQMQLGGQARRHHLLYRHGGLEGQAASWRMELLAVRQQKGLVLKALTYSVASVHSSVKQPHEAMELLAEWQQKGLAPNFRIHVARDNATFGRDTAGRLPSDDHLRSS